MTDPQRDRAIRRIRAKRGFWLHLGLYLAANAVLVAVWTSTWTGYFWPGWVWLGWGLALTVHGLAVFVVGRQISDERLQREMNQLR